MIKRNIWRENFPESLETSSWHQTEEELSRRSGRVSVCSTACMRLVPPHTWLRHKKVEREKKGGKLSFLFLRRRRRRRKSTEKPHVTQMQDLDGSTFFFFFFFTPVCLCDLLFSYLLFNALFFFSYSCGVRRVKHAGIWVKLARVLDLGDLDIMREQRVRS